MTVTDAQTSNIELVRRGFEAFGAGDMQRLAEIIDSNATWRSAPVGVLPGDQPNRDAMFAYFGQLAQETAGTFRSEPIALAAEGDKVFVQTKTTGQRKGKTIETGDVLIFTVAGGKVREIRFFAGDYPAAADFWG